MPHQAGFVEASFQYLADASARPVTYNPPPGKGLARREGNYADFRLPVRDGRGLKFSLDREGFELVPHQSRVSDLMDADQIDQVYRREMVDLLKYLTRAREVVMFDHTIRAGENNVARGFRAPVMSVHNDYTEKSGPQRVRELLGEAEAAQRFRRRFAEFNVWRPINGPVRRSPLGLVDASTIAEADLMVCDLVYEDRTGEIYQGVYNPAHRWYYFPLMRNDEVVVIKCYDSELDGRARFSLHSAFEDPTSPPDAPPRESIEIRAFAFF